VRDAGRESDFWKHHLLSYLAQDFIESCFSLLRLAIEGMFNAYRREMRFLIELIIKLCYVEQQMPGSTIDEKIEQHKKIFGSSTISEKSSLDLYMLSEKSGNQIREDLGRQYGISSNYVRLSTRQIRERIARSNNDVVAGQAI
jgi:hypothetical protein